MANTPPITADIRPFRWHDLEPAQGAAMTALVRSLGLDPNCIATDFAIIRVAGGPWRLHLTEFGQDESNPLVFDGIALPGFLTDAEPVAEVVRLAAEVERLREVVARAERDNCGCLGYPLGAA